MNDLFSAQFQSTSHLTADLTLLPLADRIRPTEFNEIYGQEHFLSDKSIQLKLFKSGHLVNLIFYGPPGTGKTTLALALAKIANAEFIQVNAVDSGVKDLKAACEKGKIAKLEQGRKTILFVDEIHRFNKSQQDVLLPYVEKGDIYLIGATTELPSYELNKALLSRAQVIEFKRLSTDALEKIIERACHKESVQLNQFLLVETVQYLINFSDGDARKLLNNLEILIHYFHLDPSLFPLSPSALEELLGKKLLSYDKKSEEHYDCVSAFIKAMRGSDPDAALYYCARMLEGGEDPVFISRRMIIFASEDIGNAEPRALTLAMSCLQAVEAIGMPEARINLAQVVTFLSSCPKSNKSYVAINRALDFVRRTGTKAIPRILRSSQKGQGYEYPHDFPKSFVKQNYWPEDLKPEIFYEPSDRGFEKNLKDYLNWLKS